MLKQMGSEICHFNALIGIAIGTKLIALGNKTIYARFRKQIESAGSTS